MKKHTLVVALFLNYFVLFGQKTEEEEISGMQKVAKSLANYTRANVKALLKRFEFKMVKVNIK